jgi:hypothetical protein
LVTRCAVICASAIAALMKNGCVVGTARVEHLTKDEVLGIIILGKCPSGAFCGLRRGEAE